LYNITVRRTSTAVNADRSNEQRVFRHKKNNGPRKPGGFRGPCYASQQSIRRLLGAITYFFGAACFSIFSAAFFSSLVDGAAGAASVFVSLLEALQPQLLFTSLPQLEQPQLLFDSLQPQLLASQPQLFWQPHS
jgi:hypothetical protein